MLGVVEDLHSLGCFDELCLLVSVVPAVRVVATTRKSLANCIDST